MYKEYVHMLENAFEVLRHSEDGISRWSGMPPSPEAHAAFGSLAGKAADCWLAHLDSCGKTLQWYSGARTQAAKTYDRYVHSTINGYVQMIEQYAASSGNWWERWYAKRRPESVRRAKEGGPGPLRGGRACPLSLIP